MAGHETLKSKLRAMYTCGDLQTATLDEVRGDGGPQDGMSRTLFGASLSSLHVLAKPITLLYINISYSRFRRWSRLGEVLPTKKPARSGKQGIIIAEGTTRV